MGGWYIIKFRPGKYPYKTLTDIITSLEQEVTDQIDQEAIEIKHNNQCLKQVVEKLISKNCSQRLLLVVDQFEEIYTICENEKECQKFLDELLICVRDAAKFTILFTMRADFLNHALSYRPFVDELQNQKDFKIGLMNQKELKKVIENPGKTLLKNKFYPVTLESGLTETILMDVGYKAENLPLLEFTLTQLWKKQTNCVMTHKSYHTIGGVKESIANHAEEIYRQLEDEKRKKLEKIFIQLINPENGTAYTRRVASRTNLGEDNWELITYLNSENVRLVIINYNEEKSQETVEIIHEALIENWSRLHQWMKKNYKFRTWQEELRRKIDEWNELNKDESILLRGLELDVAFKYWYRNRFNDLDKEERYFIRQSWERQQREIQERKREKQRFTIAVTFLICLGIGVIGLIVLLNKQTLLITFIVANKQYLTGKNLQNFHMQKINLSNGNLIKINLSNANLDGSNFLNANVEEAKLHYTHAQKAQFQGANLSRADFSNANLDGSNFSNANLKEAKLHYTYVQKAQFQGANLSRADFSHANLDKSNFSNANFEEAKLHYTYAQKAQFQGTNLSKADFSNANLDESDFSNANLKEAKLHSAHTHRAQFRGANLSRSDFSSANLDGANFSRAKLNGANFSDAYMSNVNFQNADLLQVDFRSVQNLTIEQVKSAQNWEKALYDEDFAKKLNLK